MRLKRLSGYNAATSMSSTLASKTEEPLALPKQPDRARSRALIAMFTATLLFSLMGLSIKWASRTGVRTAALPGAELAFFRYAFGVLSLFILARMDKNRLQGTDRKGLLWRGLFGGVASTCFFLGIEHTSLTHATLLNYTFVIWGPLFAVFSLNETLGRRGVLAMMVALGGILFVTNPLANSAHAGATRTGDAIALFSGIMAGASIVQIRRLRQGESSIAIFFYFNLLGLPTALLTLLFMHTPFILPTLTQIPILLAIGATSVSAQLLMTYGYREMTAAQGSLINLTSVLFTALFAYLLFHDPFTWPTLIGGLLILLSAITLCLRSTPSKITP